LNYRWEKLEFEVMDWPSQYHAILGRPVFLRFMAVPHYTYLVLKMLGPNGIITVKGSFELSYICDKEFHKMGQSFSTTTKYREAKGRAECSTSFTPTFFFLKNNLRLWGKSPTAIYSNEREYRGNVQQVITQTLIQKDIYN
jgi:hypothetical protein